MTSFAQAVERIIATLDRLEIPFVIGGSVASASYGIPRQTKDVDIVLDCRPEDITSLCEELSTDFYLDEQQAKESLAAGRSFNAIHLKGAFKFDFFPVRDSFTRSELARRRFSACAIPGLENLELPISSPEDSVLAKLAWFRMGGEISDRQWHDILGMLSVQAGYLDLEYLQEWACRLEVSDLLESAIEEASQAGE